jgi:hypothetical protein
MRGRAIVASACATRPTAAFTALRSDAAEQGISNLTASEPSVLVKLAK